MAITSKGYPGDVTPGSAYAEAQINAGRLWAFIGANAFKPVINETGTRLLDIETGTVFAQGIVTKSTTKITVQVPESTGTSQWYMVTARFWAPKEGGGYQTDIEFIAGNANRATPARTLTVGTEYHVPICLARVTSVGAQITHLVDMRVIATAASGFVVCHSDLGMNLLAGQVGATVYRTDDDTFYRRIINAVGTGSWSNQDTLVNALIDAKAAKVTDTVFGLPTADEWTRANTGNYASRLTKKFDHVDMFLIMRRTGGKITAGDHTGNIGDMEVFKLDAPYRPKEPVITQATYWTGSGQANCQVTIYPGGGIVLTALTPGLDLPNISSGGYSLRVSASYSVL